MRLLWIIATPNIICLLCVHCWRQGSHFLSISRFAIVSMKAKSFWPERVNSMCLCVRSRFCPNRRLSRNCKKMFENSGALFQLFRRGLAILILNMAVSFFTVFIRSIWLCACSIRILRMYSSIAGSKTILRRFILQVVRFQR